MPPPRPRPPRSRASMCGAPSARGRPDRVRGVLAARHQEGRVARKLCTIPRCHPPMGLRAKRRRSPPSRSLPSSWSTESNSSTLRRRYRKIFGRAERRQQAEGDHDAERHDVPHGSSPNGAADGVLVKTDRSPHRRGAGEAAAGRGPGSGTLRIPYAIRMPSYGPSAPPATGSIALPSSQLDVRELGLLAGSREHPCGRVHPGDRRVRDTRPSVPP